MDQVQHDAIIVLLAKIENTQEHILNKIAEVREENKAMEERMDSVEEKINYAAGAVAISGFFFIMFFDWVKQKLFGTA